jgi:hypothetical protein
MSSTRNIWNDGQGLATPDLQRSADAAAAADDRVFEVLTSPGSVQKKILPLSEETATLNPRLLAVPSTGALSPVGTNGAVRVMPCCLVAGSPTSTQQIALSANLQAPLDTAAITSNSSGGIRYDLVYATVNRAVSVTGTRKIKSATDGSLSSQTVNLADAPAVTLGVNVGFLTGATAPTAIQINAALPSDTAPSSSTFGSFSFPIAYVTVANGYTSGTTLFQDSSGGTTYITQCWSGGFVPGQRVRGPRPMSLYYGAANEKPSSSVLTKGTQNGERWGSQAAQYFVHFKLLNTSGISMTAGITLDNTIDWRNRFVWGVVGYTSMSGNVVLESAAANSQATPGYVVSSSVYGSGTFNMFWSGAGSASGLIQPSYIDSAGPTKHVFGLGVFTDGSLRAYKVDAPIDTVNGDLVVLVVYATDPLKLNG